MENKMLFIGALGAFFLATAATLVSDIHGIGDWSISSLQARKYALNPAPIFGTPYTIAGYFGEPLLGGSHDSIHSSKFQRMNDND